MVGHRAISNRAHSPKQLSRTWSRRHCEEYGELANGSRERARTHLWYPCPCLAMKTTLYAVFLSALALRLSIWAVNFFQRDADLSSRPNESLRTL